MLKIAGGVMFIEYIDRENKKQEMFGLLIENKLTEEQVSNYITELHLTNKEIEILDEALGAVASAIGKGLAKFGKSALRGGVKLAKKAVVGGAKLAGKAVGAGVSSGIQAFKKGMGTQQAAQVQPQAQAQSPIQPQQQQNVLGALNTLTNSLQNNPQALKLLQQFLPQFKNILGMV